MLRAFNFLGPAKWPMLALVTIAPAIAYTQWLPPAPRLVPIGTVTIMDQRYRVDGLVEDDGEQLLSIRAIVAPEQAMPRPGPGPRAAAIRLVEAGWDVDGDAGNFQQGGFEAGAAVITLLPRPAGAETVTIRMENTDRDDAVAVIAMPAPR